MPASLANRGPANEPTPGSRQTATSAWPNRMGEWGSFLFSFFALLGTTPASVGLVALALAFLWDFRHWRVLGQDPIIKVCLVFAVYTAGHSLIAYVTAPGEELAEAVADTGTDWIKLLLFVPFAYWVGGRRQRIGWLLFLALLGFAIGFLRKIDWASFDATFFYTRFEVYLPAIAFGMFAGLAVLGLIALREAFWAAGSSRIPGWVRLASWLLLLALMLVALFLSFSRSTWIAFAVAALLLFYLEWRAHPALVQQSQGKATRRALSGLLVAVSLMALVVTQWDRIADRMFYENQTAAQVLRGDWSEVDSNSIGLRIHALRFTAHLWSERPWLGWGAGSSRYLIAHSERPELLMDEGIWLPHLHNAYAEILVQLGAVGLVLAAAIIFLLVRGTARECRSGKVPRALCRFLLATAVYVLLWNLGSFRIVRHDGLFFWIMFAGVAYSFRLRTLIENARDQTAGKALGSKA